LYQDELEKMKALLKGKDIVAYSDGASFKNPGPAGSGVAFFEKNGAKETYLCGAFHSLGKASNNYAEYFGLILAQTLLLISGVKNPSFKTDSNILVHQVHANKTSGNNLTLFAFKEIIVKLFKHLGPIQLSHVYRDFNEEADALSKKAAEASINKKSTSFAIRFFPCIAMPPAAEMYRPN
jgi:ribonuclease HI